VHGVLIGLTATCLAATGETRPLAECIPAGAMAVYFGRPAPEMLSAPPGGMVDQLAAWLITLKAVGVIPREGRIIADIVGTLPLLGRRPHALGLLDITAKEVRPGVYRLNDLQSVLVIDSQGLDSELDRRVRDLLATYTDAGSGRIEVALAGGGVSYHRLVDQRLPEWATVEWGTIGAHFVVTMGPGVWGKMVDTLAGRGRALADEPWFARSHQPCSGATSGIEVYADLARLRARLEKTVKGRPEAVLAAMHLDKAERLLWTVGYQGRALRSEAMVQETGGEDRHGILAGEAAIATEVAASIPAEASRYAAFRLPLAEVFRNGRQAYLEGKSPEVRQRLRRGWAQLEQEFDLDVEPGLLDQLGEHLVFHTWPPHPLGLPMLCTIGIQITGQRAAVADTVDRLMTAWQRHMNGPQEAAENGSATATRPAVGLAPRLRRDVDGVWYLQLGFVGPALAVADGWIVISFSPQAVRQNLEHLSGSSAGQPRP